jgi:hypothetical protein
MRMYMVSYAGEVDLCSYFLPTSQAVTKRYKHVSSNLLLDNTDVSTGHHISQLLLLLVLVFVRKK